MYAGKNVLLVRPAVLGSPTGVGKVNPHIYVRCDRYNSEMQAWNYQFQSTRLREARLNGSELMRGLSFVSIHAPA